MDDTRHEKMSLSEELAEWMSWMVLGQLKPKDRFKVLERLTTDFCVGCGGRRFSGLPHDCTREDD